MRGGGNVAPGLIVATPNYPQHCSQEAKDDGDDVNVRRTSMHTSLRCSPPHKIIRRVRSNFLKCDVVVWDSVQGVDGTTSVKSVNTSHSFLCYSDKYSAL